MTAAPSGPDALPTATLQDGTHPRPQALRAHWRDLSGPWSFRHDDGGSARWSHGLPEPRTITVPFPPESSASGIDEPGFHPVVWYARTLAQADLDAAGLSPENPRVLLHFGAVDHRATVWIDGALVGEHEGGQTPFTFDVTGHLAGGGEHLLVVRAEDDPHDVSQPRGKQDWQERPHAIWYRRTTGIWQPVWLEAVPDAAVEHLRWTNRDAATTGLTVRFRGAVPEGARVAVALRWTDGDEDLGALETAVPPHARSVDLLVPVARQANGQAEEELLWSPDQPRLIDAVVELRTADGRRLDAVASYFGLRTVAVDRGAFLLNDRPVDVRSVLEQGYWPESHLAAPSPAALRREVELIKALGFNAARIHQKVEDPRFLFWADRLGLLVWGETANAYAFSPLAVQRLVREWVDVVERDASHPSIVTWVPLNESWGVQHVAHEPAQQAYARALAEVTRALDPTRPVVSNDGWEHPGSDIVTVHDYEGDGERLAATYADDAARTRLLAGIGPAGRRILVGGAVDEGQPVMLTEFGGVRYQPDRPHEEGWGYTEAADEDDWIRRITALYDGVRASAFLAGSCWTQLTDTLQETNGLLTADREPKAPIERIRAAILGS
ncbi:glycoside hydrolase family 2 protein [Amnibacterium setariae]|uniref:Glycoside hydrolase family 2 n=1 Tax=Amnibacterium setariae TaxID=2306585 RepID=A0A3A1U889_9MICO|nr:glycoside hydrolase family 2 TIM barrel-domain containing protein [Amnibacterium setariae]RIX31278.1 glycoside hydrolase family 2 [Amnibacterium setariae]